MGSKNNSSSNTRDQMTPSHQRHHLGLTSLRNSLACIFLVVSMLYVLYSSSNLLFTRDRPCKTLVDISTHENLEKLLPLLNYTIASKSLDNDTEENRECTVDQKSQGHNTELKHIVFGIAASSSLWEKRKQYIKMWWRPKKTRGVVWLDKRLKTRRNEGLPEIRVSTNTSQFKYTNPQGKRSALRISRVVSETIRLGMKDVRWFVMGDDDTVFVVDNVVRVLSKYDYRKFYYIGSSSESHLQNIYFSYGMAYGGGGFAISYPLAKELEKMQDRCIQRYPGLYGSDDRMQACMAELGVPLTREAGFHQVINYSKMRFCRHDRNQIAKNQIAKKRLQLSLCYS